MVPINPKNINRVCSELASQSNLTKTVSRAIDNSRELEMIPKYLELASLKGLDRFNSEQIQSITALFGKYQTQLSKTDLLKDLLAIGIEKGKPLSSEELAGFLNATSSMKQLEQKNVLRFLKAAKEQEVAKVTPEYLKQRHPYEEFKQRYIQMKKADKWEKGTEYLKEENIQSLYETFISSEYKIAANKYYQQARTAQMLSPSQCITKGNSKEFVNAVAKCTEPEKLAAVIEKTGINPTVTASANALANIYKLSGDNQYIVKDLARAFYPAEIKQIAEILLNRAKTGKVLDWDKYTVSTAKNYNDGISSQSLSTQRKNVIKELGLEGEIKLLPLRTIEDVYPASDFAGRGNKLAGGNFERGKKK